ncbi:YihY/virulence factor BrkB family protein [Bacillus sp. FJAT-49736]|uniref:YihY/virulence factor BrkB family protein n=1 Tax=Bacillus sp. FJAT-49736 TaxID=2833582 RepID=UPI001BC9FCB3|nr:YihY/virulence factor BrkB family protein [Bacillus sp. FJAT-49736]MBS4175038.1 YihY/virulence factor BrkB family protein [Bacillus sp. FJAT-49736]
MGKAVFTFKNGIQFIKMLWKRIDENDLSGMAAQLAYFFLLSLFPLLLFMVSLLSYLPLTTDDLLNVIRDFAPKQTLAMIRENIQEILSNRNGGLLSFGIIATIWSASLGMNAIIGAMNRAYEVKETRSFFITRGLSILLTIAMIFVLLIALIVPIFGEVFGIYIFSYLGISDQFAHFWNGLRWLISMVILFVVFMCLYYMTPNKKIRCLTVIPGAVIATVGWAFVSFAFSFYVGNFGHYSTTYGSLGGIIVLILWFYLTGFILMIGGEVNAILTNNKKSC